MMLFNIMEEDLLSFIQCTKMRVVLLNRILKQLLKPISIEDYLLSKRLLSMIRVVVLLFKLHHLTSLKTNTRMIYATIKFLAQIRPVASSVKVTSILLII